MYFTKRTDQMTFSECVYEFDGTNVTNLNLPNIGEGEAFRSTNINSAHFGVLYFSVTEWATGQWQYWEYDVTNPPGPSTLPLHQSVSHNNEVYFYYNGDSFGKERHEPKRNAMLFLENIFVLLPDLHDRAHVHLVESGEHGSRIFCFHQSSGNRLATRKQWLVPPPQTRGQGRASTSGCVTSPRCGRWRRSSASSGSMSSARPVRTTPRPSASTSSSRCSANSSIDRRGVRAGRGSCPDRI